ncbi:hypothetical protein LPY66_13205 [Dehalobacter sp. DCM]|uniref:hypothetical protein n=1 Tax=Dehalobacter sp. DCM TaxID=2907827 RepID=UPI00308121FC|nr:hypothetical protein LPY66_13205 [Dehalobacter sp. DCM]
MQEYQRIDALQQKPQRHSANKTKIDDRVETISVQDALGRVNYREIIAENTLPNKSISVVDGIAVKLIYFDYLDTTEWGEGYEYIFRKSGSEIPYGFDAVVSENEYSLDAEGRLTIFKIPKPGKNIIPAGSVMKKNEIIVRALAPLGQLELELLKVCGITTIEVLI